MNSNDFVKLYNTLALIETKGENTKLMAQCMVFVEQLANEARQAEVEAAQEKEESQCKKSQKKQ